MHEGDQQVSFRRTTPSSTLGLSTTAEPIETPEHAEGLRALG